MEKAVELEELLSGREGAVVILGLTETQQKYRKVDFGDNILRLDKMREIDDKKGGGLTILMNKPEKTSMREIPSDDCDVMRVEVELGSIVINVLLVYIDGKLKSRFEKTYRCINGEMEKIKENEYIIILGDFNSHVGFLGPQKLEEKGRLLLNLIEKWNLIMLNGDQRCLGEITRVQGRQRSAIDYILVNQNLYNKFVDMEIDEDKRKYDLSDHCLLEARFSETEIRNQGNAGQLVTNEYYKINSEELKKLFLQEIEKQVLEESEIGEISQERFEEILKRKCEEVLKKKIIKREYDNRRGSK